MVDQFNTDSTLQTALNRRWIRGRMSLLASRDTSSMQVVDYGMSMNNEAQGVGVNPSKGHRWMLALLCNV